MTDQLLKLSRAWRDVVALATRLGIEVRTEVLAMCGSRPSDMPDGGHEAPMWRGWIVPGKEVVVDPASFEFRHSTAAHHASMLLHELAHTVCGMDEDDVLEWEVYAACVLWGRYSHYTRDVVHYQIWTVDHDYDRESNDDRVRSMKTGRRRRRDATRRAQQGLPPRLGPVVTSTPTQQDDDHA